MTEIETSVDLGGHPVEDFFVLKHGDQRKLKFQTEDGGEIGFKLSDDQLERLSEVAADGAN